MLWEEAGKDWTSLQHPHPQAANRRNICLESAGSVDSNLMLGKHSLGTTLALAAKGVCAPCKLGKGVTTQWPLVFLSLYPELRVAKVARD